MRMFGGHSKPSVHECLIMLLKPMEKVKDDLIPKLIQIHLEFLSAP